MIILLTSILAFSEKYWSSNSFIYAYMVVYNVLSTFACIGIFAIAMQCCWKKVSASQFTLFMTIGNLGRIALASLIGPLITNFSWQLSIFAFAIMIGTAWLLLQFFNIERQIESLAGLENKDLESKIFEMAAK